MKKFVPIIAEQNSCVWFSKALHCNGLEVNYFNATNINVSNTHKEYAHQRYKEIPSLTQLTFM